MSLHYCHSQNFHFQLHSSSEKDDFETLSKRDSYDDKFELSSLKSKYLNLQSKEKRMEGDEEKEEEREGEKEEEEGREREKKEEREMKEKKY